MVKLLDDMAQQLDTAILIVTHDEKIIPTFRRLYSIRDGVTGACQTKCTGCQSVLKSPPGFFLRFE